MINSAGRLKIDATKEEHGDLSIRVNNYLSTAMIQLRKVVEKADSNLFERICFGNEQFD